MSSDNDFNPRGSWFERMIDTVVGVPLRMGHRVADFLLSFFERAEFFFGSLTDNVGDVGSNLGQALLQPLFAFVAWVVAPFALLGLKLQGMFGSLFDRSEWIVGQSLFAAGEVLAIVGKVLFWIPCQIADAILGWLWRGPLGALVRWSARLVVPEYVLDRIPRFDSVADVLISGYSTATEFFVDWWESRDLRQLAMATPAILLGIAGAGCLSLSVARSESDTTLHYRRSLNQALLEKNEAKSQIILARLGQLGYRRHDAERYRAALSKEETSGVLAAMPLMEELLTTEDGGFGPAKIWIAYRLLSGKSDLNEVASVDRAAELLASYLEFEPETEDTRLLESEILLRRTGVRAGIAVLESIPNAQRFEIPARLMQLHLQVGNNHGVQSQAMKAVEAYAAQVRQSYQFTPDQNLQYVEALAYCGRWAEVKSALDALEFPTVGMAHVIDRVADLAPSIDRELAFSMYRLSHDCRKLNVILADGIVAGDQRMIEFVEQQTANQAISSDLFRLVGDKRLMKEDFAGGLEWYEKALAVNPEDAKAANNVAWLHLRANRLEKALAAADQTVQLQPLPNYLETRGQILARLSRFEDSISDLEKALNGRLPNPSAAHMTLSKMYASVGQHDLSQMHRIRGLNIRSPLVPRSTQNN